MIKVANNYRNRKYETVINKLRIGHTNPTRGLLKKIQHVQR